MNVDGISVVLKAGRTIQHMVWAMLVTINRTPDYGFVEII